MEVSAAALAWGLDVTVSLLCRVREEYRELPAKHVAFLSMLEARPFSESKNSSSCIENFVCRLVNCIANERTSSLSVGMGALLAGSRVVTFVQGKLRPQASHSADL
jgi:hypothetical protein